MYDLSPSDKNLLKIQPNILSLNCIPDGVAMKQ